MHISRGSKFWKARRKKLIFDFLKLFLRKQFLTKCERMNEQDRRQCDQKVKAKISQI